MSLSIRILIHILAVFCLSYRLVSSEDTDLLDAVVAANDASAKSSTTDMPTDPSESTTYFSTTEGESTTTPDPITTDAEVNTTESIVSTSAFPGNLSCVLYNELCVLEGTEDLCDPCDGVDCDADKSCLADNSTCTITCQCTDPLKTPNKDGVCTNPCEPTPCLNKQPCVSDVTRPSKFRCDCISDYEGELCGTEHNYCKETQPAGCPKGAFDCVFNGVGKYDCTCAGGHTLDTETNTCIKVTQRLGVTLIFSTLYKEAYNVEGTDERKMALADIGGAMTDLYGSLLISITYYDFTQGSLVANYSMDMRMPPNGDPMQNVYDLMTYTTNCETNNPLKKTCFKELGKPHIPMNGIVAEDLRCDDVFCPIGTECTVDNSENAVRCSCSSGYKLVRTVKEDTGRQIDVCDDIDECKVDNPCPTEKLCVNNPGSFECLGSPCDKNPCPGNAVCNAIDHYTYDCQCEWIYIASDCGTPWPLILVIVSSVLLALLILAVIGLIILFSRSKKGSYSIFTTKEPVFPYDHYGSTSHRN